jgi:hypothetical protein
VPLLIEMSLPPLQTGQKILIEIKKSLTVFP